MFCFAHYCYLTSSNVIKSNVLLLGLIGIHYCTTPDSITVCVTAKVAVVLAKHTQPMAGKVEDECPNNNSPINPTANPQRGNIHVPNGPIISLFTNFYSNTML